MSVLTRSPTCRLTESHVSRPVCIGASSTARYFPLFGFHSSRNVNGDETRLGSFGGNASERARIVTRTDDGSSRETRISRTNTIVVFFVFFFFPRQVAITSNRSDQVCISGVRHDKVNVGESLKMSGGSDESRLLDPVSIEKDRSLEHLARAANEGSSIG